jgi:S-formylglutathione hydrolase FrmB
MKKLGFLLLFLSNALFAQVRIHLAPHLQGPYSGKLLVYTVSDTTKHFGADTYENEAAFTMQVSEWTNGKVITLPPDVQFFNTSLKDLKDGYYRMVAILRTNTSEHRKLSVGNLYTRNEVILKVQKGQDTSVDLELNAAMPDKVFKEDDNTKLVKFLSPSLTAQKKEETSILGGICLPPSFYKEKDRTYPVVFIHPGWGGTHFHATNPGVKELYGVGRGEEKIFVFMNPEAQTPYGLHAFVDSRVNGNWGTAFVQEFIPYLVRNYRVNPNPKMHFLTGQSTGGYGVLWLALHFPESFGGTWATSPDPIDFSAFTGINIYEDKNYFLDSNGKERGFMLVDGNFKTTIRKMIELERFEGDGGQQQSFEAEFGLPDEKGRPIHLMDVTTGEINREVAESWKPYDLALYTLNNKEKLKKLAGPVKIYVGGKDNFFLHKSAQAYQEKTKDLGLNIQVFTLPESDHFNVRTVEFSAEMQKEIDMLIKN